MKIKKLLTNEIFVPKEDYKITDNKLFSKLEYGIKKYGQIKPIVVWENTDGTYKIVDGIRIYLVALSLGWENITAIILSPKLEEYDTNLIRVLLNQFKFDYDVVKMVDFMHTFMDKYKLEELENILPYTLEELNSYKELFDFDWSTFSDEKSKSNKVLIKSKKMF